MTAEYLLNRGFKRPSRIARQQGWSRQILERLVNVAESKLLELAPPPSMMRHEAGSLLTTNEKAQLMDASNCMNDRKTKQECLNIPMVNTFRPSDATCNNIDKPLQGASDTSFRRLIGPVYEDTISVPRGTSQAMDPLKHYSKPNPSARFISSTVVKDSNRQEPFSHMVMQFGQFLDHDLDLAPELELVCDGCKFTDECFPIHVRKDDPKFGKSLECLPFHRSIATCGGLLQPREQLNTLTSYIDGSMIYGSNINQAKLLRSYHGGLLRVGPVIGDGDSLVRDDAENVGCREGEECFLCGDVRCNEQVSLTVMHTLWVREHNRIARELGHMNLFWSDERIYQETRKIIGAMIQKIVYYDYLPKILGTVLYEMVVGEYEGYLHDVDASVPNSFATAAFRFGHSLVRPSFPRLTPDYTPAQPDLKLSEMFFNPSMLAASNGVGRLARGWMEINSMDLDEFLTSVLTSKLFQTSVSPGLDLASLNIQRQRDHGIPTYGAWKDFCASKFPELAFPEIANGRTKALLKMLHGSVDNSELWLAGISEKNYPESIIGPTFACIFGLTFKNLRDGDRFYFEKSDVFSSKQLKQIKKASFARVICDNSDTISIQPDVFLLNQTRVYCYHVPSISLTPWRESTCFINIKAPVNQVVTGISKLFYTKTNSLRKTSTYVTKEASSFRCLPVLCPTKKRSLRLTVFGSPSTAQCTTLVNSESLTINGNTVTYTPSSYEYTSQYENIIFHSEDACKWHMHEPVIEVQCEKQLTDEIDGQENLMNNPESPEYTGSVPGDVSEQLELEILNSDNGVNTGNKGKGSFSTNGLQSKMSLLPYYSYWYPYSWYTYLVNVLG